jgi:hypothetical protein
MGKKEKALDNEVLPEAFPEFLPEPPLPPAVEAKEVQEPAPLPRVDTIALNTFAHRKGYNDPLVAAFVVEQNLASQFRPKKYSFSDWEGRFQAFLAAPR